MRSAWHRLGALGFQGLGFRFQVLGLGFRVVSGLGFGTGSGAFRGVGFGCFELWHLG